MTAADDAIVELSRQRIERGSKSFAAAARLFPREVRNSAYMLYAWCRYCDDVIDGQELGFHAPAACSGARATGDPSALIDDLRQRTTDACRGNPSGPVFEALCRVIAKHEIPERFPQQLIDGFAMDANGRDCATLTDTLVYAYHVAGVVGLMMAMVMGVRDKETMRRAADLGIAFQLTNISRDVMEDAQIGRLYLPRCWLEEEGLAVSAICDRRSRAAVSRATLRLLEEADQYYASATFGIAALPFRCATAIAAARSVYRAIGTTVRRRAETAWDQRAIVPTRRKIAILAAAPLVVSYAKISSLAGQPSRAGLWTHPDLEDAR